MGLRLRSQRDHTQDKFKPRLWAVWNMASACSRSWCAAVLLIVSSLGVLAGNSYLAKRYHAGNLLIVLQNAVAVTLLSICGRFHCSHGCRVNGGFSLNVRPLLPMQFAIMLVPTALNALQLLTSIKALAYVGATTPLIFRTASTVLCALIEETYFGETFTLNEQFALLMMLFGSLLYAQKDIFLENYIGYMWLLCNMITYLANNIYNKQQVFQIRQQTATGIALVKLLLSLPVFGSYALVWGEIPHGIYDLTELGWDSLVAFLFLGMMAALLSISCECVILLL